MNRKTKHVLIVSPKSPEMPVKPFFAITEVKPAKNIEMKANTTQLFIAVILYLAFIRPCTWSDGRVTEKNEKETLMGRFSNATIIMASGAKLPEAPGVRAWLVFYRSAKGIRKRSRAGSSECLMPNSKSRETGGGT